MNEQANTEVIRSIYAAFNAADLTAIMSLIAEGATWHNQGAANVPYAGSYNGKTEFYLTDSLDPQKLYNSARNIEIAAWKLAHARDARGEPLLLSNEMAGDARNLSFEREFGKMIAYQDVMAQIAAQRTNRVIRRVVQTLATAVFLPI